MPKSLIITLPDEKFQMYIIFLAITSLKSYKRIDCRQSTTLPAEVAETE